jgi:hypothetical protein
MSTPMMEAGNSSAPETKKTSSRFLSISVGVVLVGREVKGKTSDLKVSYRDVCVWYTL